MTLWERASILFIQLFSLGFCRFEPVQVQRQDRLDMTKAVGMSVVTMGPVQQAEADALAALRITLHSCTEREQPAGTGAAAA